MRTIVWALLLSLPCFGVSSQDRRGWVYEGLSYFPPFRDTQRMRHQVYLNTVNYHESFSTQATGLLDFKAFEVSVRGGGYSQFGSSQRALQLESQLEDQRYVFGGDIARQGFSADSYYGRLSFGWLFHLPIQKHSQYLGLDLGRVRDDRVPWDLFLQMAWYLNTPSDSSFVVVRSENRTVVLNSARSTLSIGGFFSWTYRTQDKDAGVIVQEVAAEQGVATSLVTGANRTQEHMVFSIGPSAVYETPFGRWDLSIYGRLWLDKNKVGTNLNTPNVRWVTLYPTELTGPDIHFGWTWAF